MQKIKTLENIIFNSKSINNISNSLRSILNFKTIMVYGYGNGFSTLHSFVLDKFNIPISYIFDSKFVEKSDTSARGGGGEYLGNPIKICLKDFKSSLVNNKETVVIVSLGDSPIRNHIRNDLHAKGFTNIVNCEEIYEWHLHYTPKTFDVSSELKLNYKKINSIYTQLGDQKSKDIYLGLVKFYRMQKIIKIKNESYDKQYIFHLIKEIDTLYDCGANKGEVYCKLKSKYGKFYKVFLFEPNFAYIHELNILKDNELRIGNEINVIESAVLDVTSKNNKLNLRGTNSTILETSAPQISGYSAVSSVKLDDFQTKSNSSLLKMDIEGSEVRALLGGLNLIHQMYPYLAISIYHKISDLWLIFDLLEKFDYKFYIRNYSGFVSETILYGIPKYTS